MANTGILESELRTLFKDQLMMSQIDFMDKDDELNLDSLAQTELRVYLSERYQFDTGIESMPVHVTESLARLMDYILYTNSKAA